MDTTDGQRQGRSGINNYYYGEVKNVINLKLSKDQVAVLGSGNNIAETINSLMNPFIKNGDGK